tara:strand:+ start:1478 stop:2275 length:798 start_codon:yes stop_codon:yes gene_type:complete
MSSRVEQFKRVQISAECFCPNMIILPDNIDDIKLNKHIDDFINLGQTIKHFIIVEPDSIKILNVSMLEELLYNLHNASLFLYTVLKNNCFVDCDKTSIITMFNKTRNDAFELFKRKNSDYGDAFAIYGIIGIIVRLGDKFERLSSLSKKKFESCVEESISDTIIDIYNYTTMTVMLIHENNESIKMEEITHENLKSMNLAKILNIKRYVLQNYYDSHNKINFFSEKISIINEILENKCKHQWEIITDEYCDGRTPHKCKLCGLHD